jgi:chromosome partitioning protein
MITTRYKSNRDILARLLLYDFSVMGKNSIIGGHIMAPQSIAFVHHKGGTGKTTACVNIAGYLQKQEQRVLVIDLDPQGNATAGLGIDRRAMEHSIYDVLFGKLSLQDIILEADCGVHIAPASIDLLSAEMHMTELRNPTGVLREKLTDIAAYYDYVLIDVPPGSTMLMINGIVAADSLIVPVDAGIFGVETLETLKILLDHVESELGRVTPLAMVLLREYPASLFGRDPTKNLWKMTQAFLLKYHMTATQIITIPYARAVYDAQVKGAPLSHYKPHSNVGRAFNTVTHEIMRSSAQRATLMDPVQEVADATP